MPTILQVQGFRVYFYSHEPDEPPHVHVDKGGASAKIWLDGETVARSVGFKPRELREVVTIVRAHRGKLREAWRDFFGD